MKPAALPDPADVVVYDTTLRDGTQREGISLSCADKLRIARRLDRIGVAIIEGGWPGSNPKDVELFARARDEQWTHASLAAFGATRRAGVAVEDDASIAALLEAGTPVCTIFGKSSTLHVREVLRTTLDENLRLVEESVAYLRAHGRRVVFDAEHFFDGYAADPAYALEVLAAAARAGAEALVLCDTNGGRLPWEVEAATAVARSRAGGAAIGIHTHDDGGCAVANALAAVRAGATHVQGTINGYGERCGNANLCALIPDLELKLGRRCLPAGSLPALFELAHFVAEVANLPPDEHQPYVGRCAFAHKGGVHVAAVRRRADAYEHVSPEKVGNRTRVVVSELSGRANVLAKAEELGVAVGEDAADAIDALAEIKLGEARGLSFEAAEASVALLLRRRAPRYAAPFRLIEYRVMTGFQERLGNWAEATIKVAVGAQIIHAVAEGTGPVHALDGALRKALAPAFPEVDAIRLTDYRVRILDSQSATAATTRVLIDSSDGARAWSTVGAGTDILAASWAALADSFEYGLTAEVIANGSEGARRSAPG
jgi:2-isopropylmalate synthase